MILVTVELISAIDGHRETLGTATIANVAGTHDIADYNAVIFKGKKYSQDAGGVWKRGYVEEFPRLRLGPWDLLYRALKNMVGTRNDA